MVLRYNIIEALAQAFLHQIKICPLSAKMARLKIRKASKKKGKSKYSVMEKGIRTAAGRQTIKSGSNKAPLHETRQQGTGWVRTLNFLSALWKHFVISNTAVTKQDFLQILIF